MRCKENLFGNFVTDLYKCYTQSDVAFINSGFIRHDSVIPAGPFQVKEIFKLIIDIVTVKKMTG